MSIILKVKSHKVTLTIGEALIYPEMHLENPLVAASYQGYSEILKGFKELEAKNVELENRLELAEGEWKTYAKMSESMGKKLAEAEKTILKLKANYE